MNANFHFSISPFRTGDHLGIRRVVDFLDSVFGLDSWEEVAMRLHTIDPSVFRQGFFFSLSNTLNAFQDNYQTPCLLET